MTIEDLVRAFAETWPTAVVLTAADIEPPGPTVFYVNPAFTRMTGYEAGEVIGGSPRMLQGPETKLLVRKAFSRELRAGRPFHGHLVNYRKSGEPYICEIEAKPIMGRNGRVDYFIAFEREVRRRRGRPGAGPTGRYVTV